MIAERKRAWIQAPEIGSLNGLNPLSGVYSISGVRIYNVGQGDAIAILDQAGDPFLFLDYGGKQGRPFKPHETEGKMPVPPNRVMMLTHWDQDHWWSARNSNQARSANWLVPRQLTSPSAVKFSLDLDRVQCVPEAYVGRALCFKTSAGDRIHFEKIAHAPPETARAEDCNFSGIAVSVIKTVKNTDFVMLLPGDAPFDRVHHYGEHMQHGARLRGVVAFHHGSRRHWSDGTREMLRTWGSKENALLKVVFSCAAHNSYGHPDEATYKQQIPSACFIYTANQSTDYVDLLF